MARIIGDLKMRALQFGRDVLEEVRRLPHETVGWVVGKQLARAATSIGANIWESDAALTDAEFANKISIARKEASETEYWLELARLSGMVDEAAFARLATETNELIRIMSTIVRKTQEYIRDK